MKKYLVLLSVVAAGIFPMLSYAQTAPLQTAPACMDVKMNLRMGSSSDPATQIAVLNLQSDLVSEGFNINTTELGTFGQSTKAAVKAFQEKYSGDILAPFGLTVGTGYFGTVTRLKMQALYGCRASVVVVPPGTNVSFAVTNLTLTNSGVNVTVCNNGSTTLPVVPFRLRLNGINRDFDAVGAHPGGMCTSDTWQYATWGLAYSPSSTFSVVALLDPNGTYKNNTLIYPTNVSTTLSVPAITGVHLAVRTLSLKSTGLQATFCNLGTKNVSSYPVVITVNGTSKNFDISSAYTSGQCPVMQWTYDNWGLVYTAGSTYSASVVVDPNHIYQTQGDDELDNVASVIGTF